MNRESIALIGYGYWGKKLYRYLKDDPTFDCRKIFFRSLKQLSDLERIERFGEEFVTDPASIWEDKSIKSVILATPIETHFSLGKKALLAGKNLLIEKPLALSRAEAISLSKLARKRDLVVLTDYIYTFSRSLQKAREEIASGTIGKVRGLYLSIRQIGRFLPHNVYWLLASHLLAVLDMFTPLGELDFQRDDLIGEGEAAETGLIRFRTRADGFAGCIDVSLNFPGKEKQIVIYGDKGSIIYLPDRPPALRVVCYRKLRGTPADELVIGHQEYDYDEANNIRLLLARFADCLRGEREDNLERAIAVTTVLEKLSRGKLCYPSLPEEFSCACPG